MADNLVYTSVARGAGIVGVFITICGLGSFVTGTVYLAKDHPQNRDSFYRGGGMWSGILVGEFYFTLLYPVKLPRYYK